MNKKGHVPTAGINTVQNEVLAKGKPTIPGSVVAHQLAKNRGCKFWELLPGIVRVPCEVLGEHEEKKHRRAYIRSAGDGPAGIRTPDLRLRRPPPYPD